MIIAAEHATDSTALMNPKCQCCVPRNLKILCQFADIVVKNMAQVSQNLKKMKTSNLEQPR